MTVQVPVRKAILERRTYDAPAEGREGKVRLDFNENTAGCSPAVTRALRKISTKQLAMYPEYERRSARLARYFGVEPEELLLPSNVSYTFIPWLALPANRACARARTAPNATTAIARPHKMIARRPEAESGDFIR